MEKKARLSVLTTSIHTLLDGLASYKKQEKDIKRTPIGKEEMKLFAGNMMCMKKILWNPPNRNTTIAK